MIKNTEEELSSTLPMGDTRGDKGSQLSRTTSPQKEGKPYRMPL